MIASITQLELLESLVDLDPSSLNDKGALETGLNLVMMTLAS